MHTFSSNMFNIPSYDLVKNFDNDYFGKYYQECYRGYMYLENNIIKRGDCTTEKKYNVFDRWLRDVKNGDNAKTYNFLTVRTRLSSHLKVTHRKNADLREFCLLYNYYIVKSYFTFGVQTVPPNKNHIYVTPTKNLDFYMYSKETLLQDGTFDTNEEKSFEKISVESNQVCVIPENKQYIMVTPSKCIFYFEETDDLCNYFYMMPKEEISETQEQSLFDIDYNGFSVKDDAHNIVFITPD